MKQVRGFTNRVEVPAFTRDATDQVVDLSGIVNVDAKLVVIEVDVPSAIGGPVAAAKVSPVGNALPSQAWGWIIPGSQAHHYRVITKLDDTGSILIACNRSAEDVAFFVVGELGGDAVIAPTPDFPAAPGWTAENARLYREVDLTPYIPAEHLGNVEAVVCHLAHGGDPEQASADARAVGSTWNGLGPLTNAKEFTIVQVDDDNTIEVREGKDTKVIPVEQLGVVYFAGFILRGEHDSGDDGAYEYHAIVDPVLDAEGLIGLWETRDVRPLTSADVSTIYSRMQSLSVGPFKLEVYEREVGSIDSALLAGFWNFTSSFTVEVDGSGDIQRFAYGNTFTKSWVFGYLDLAPPGQATDPVPAHLATNVSIDQVLSWTAGLGAASHNVYFGTDPTPEFQGNQAGLTFNPGTLVEGTTYYWRIDGVNAAGTTTGVVWQFTVIDPCNWMDAAAAADWQAGKAPPDWAAAKAAPDWYETKAAPDWAAATSGDGWFDPQECN